MSESKRREKSESIRAEKTLEKLEEFLLACAFMTFMARQQKGLSVGVISVMEGK